ncbi:MAG: SAM-dependent methyltransferase [Desulfuromonadales bacterium]|nr:SAM-dependent methyltransferase [Desulfuromonadales bacterium]
MTVKSVEEKPEFITWLRQQIEARQGVTFAWFMEQALYHPEHGYYTSARTRIGKQGDFFTSSSVHPCFGRLIARQLEQMWQLLGGGAFVVAEQGAGEGHLAVDLMDAIREDFPSFYQSLRYCIVEISSDARRRQQETLQQHVAADRVEWCDLDDLAGMRGCLLSNELVDAFPIHLVQTVAGELQEVYVIHQGDGFAEELRPPSTPQLVEYFEQIGITPAQGNRGEVNLAARDWMAQVAAVLAEGFVLTIDYGYLAGDLYAPERHAGTLLCYHKHQTNEDPYRHIGCQDMTAHVDFTSLQQVGSKYGLEPLYFGHQYQFLMGLGFLELLLQMQSREADPRKAQALRMSMKHLILPETGMGESFKVLVQGKNVGRPELLCTRRIQDIQLPVTGLF